MQGQEGGGEGGGESEGTLETFLTKGCCGILDSSIPSYWWIMTPSVNTETLVTLMRDEIQRGRDIYIIESRGHRSY